MRIRTLRTLTIALALMAALSGTTSLVQAAAEANASVSKRFPPGSIRSVNEADVALADASAERAAIEARYLADEQACHPKFFATSCIEQAKERRRVALSAVRPVEIEANAFKRQARVTERDKALAERLEKNEKERQEKDSRPPVVEPAPKDDAPAKPPGKVQTTIFDDRVEQHEAKMKRQQEEEAANAAKRAENVAAYERKQQEALERQKKVAERKAEKERKRNGKPAEGAKQE